MPHTKQQWIARATQLVLLATMLFWGSKPLIAQQVMGGDIRWECIGKDSFKLILTVYKDCNSSSLTTPVLAVTSNCGTKSLTTSITSYKDITPVCATQCTRCVSGSCTFKYGIQKIEASAVVDVSSYRTNSCCEVTISYSNCCRTVLSTGIFYLESKFNICLSTCDNAPVFQNDPISIMCLGRDVVYSNHALETDNDSLCYKLTPPLTSGFPGTVSYPRPQTYMDPIYYLGIPNRTRAFPQGFHLDKNNGTMMFRPMKEQQSVIAVMVESYRGGKRIGTLTREMVVVVIKCPNNIPPVLSGINCSVPVAANFEIEACPGKEICFTICTSDSDTADTVGIAWSGGIPDASFIVANRSSKRQSATFCWTPEYKDSSRTPYTFSVSAFDNACPVNGRTSRTFSIFVREPAPKAVLTDSLGSCGQMQLRAQQVDSTAITKYSWLVDDKTIHRVGKKADTLVHSTAISGNFKYQLEVTGTNGCTRTYSDSLIVPDHVSLITKDTILCAGDSFELKARAVSPQGKYGIHWGNPDTTYNQASRLKGLLGMKDSIVTVTINDGSCEYSRTILVKANVPPQFSLDKDIRLCLGKDIRLGARMYNDTADSDSIYQYRWYLSTDTNTLSRDTMLLVSKSNTYMLEVTDSMGCSTKDSLRTYVDTSWVPQDTSTCSGDSVFIQLPNSKPAPTYVWNDNPKDTSLVSFTGANRLLRPNKDGYYFIQRVYNYQGASCTSYDSFKVLVHPLPKITVDPKNISACPKQEVLSLEGRPANGYWTGLGISPTLTKLDLDIRTSAVGVYRYAYQYMDSNQCTSKDTVTVNLRPTPFASFTSSDTVIALGDSISFINTSGPTKHIKALWTVGTPPFAQKTGDTFTVTFNAAGRYPVSLVLLDTLSNCADTLFKNNEVRVYIGIEAIGKNSARLYPNPATTQVSIDLNSTEHSGILKLFDAAGKLVAQQTIRTNKAQLNIESLSEGVYYWNLLMDGETAVGKLVIQKP